MGSWLRALSLCDGNTSLPSSLVLHVVLLESAVLMWVRQLRHLRRCQRRRWPVRGARQGCSQPPEQVATKLFAAGSGDGERWGGSSKDAPSLGRCWQSKTQPSQKYFEVAFTICTPGCSLIAVPSGQGILFPCQSAKAGEMHLRHAGNAVCGERAAWVRSCWCVKHAE